MIDRPMIAGYSVVTREIAESKYCCGCKTRHPRIEFWVSRTNRDGLQDWCKGYSRGRSAAKRAAKEIE